MNDAPNILKRAYVLYFLLLILAVTIGVKAVLIQFVEGDKWRSKAQNLTVQYKTIDAVRGNIYDAGGGLLATSVPIYEVRWDPNTEAITEELFNEYIDTLTLCLSRVFPDRSQFQWKRRLVQARSGGERYHLIQRGVKYTELKAIREFPLFNRGRYKGGLIYLQQNKRQRPFRVLAARTIGYEREGVSPVGLEGAYSKELSGVSGKRLMKKIAGGVWMPLDDENQLEPEDGWDLHTTIDVNIQDVAEYALLKQLRKQGAAHGTVVLMEVETGEVRAIANLALGKDGKYYESYNYAIGAGTEPGSTIKLASYMAALEDGYIDLHHKIETGNGKYDFYGNTMEDSKEGGYGTISVEEAFAYSSNIAIAKIVDKHYRSNPQQFVDHFKRMRLDRKLGLEIAGEARPFIKSADDSTWSGITLPWMSHGYELTLTPMQILAFYNAVANDGKLVKPQFVTSVRKGNEVVKRIEPAVLNEQIASPETIAKAQQMLEAVVEYGTATNLNGTSYRIAGKTGTAQIAYQKGGYRQKNKVSYQASFCGYFPADNPKYSCIVVVNAPSRYVYYGNLVAGPIFREIADKVYATRVDIHEPLEEQPITANTRIPVAKTSEMGDLSAVYDAIGVTYEKTEEDIRWGVASTGAEKVTVKEKHLKQGLVPNVRGMNSQDAVYLLENLGLRVELRGRGAVNDQSIAPGAQVINGNKIILELT